MSAKHLDGPWLAIGEKVFATQENGGDFICSVEHAILGVPCDYNAPTARLIAAAPDLLDALEAVLRVADRKTDEFDAARAAIAKARGVA